VLDSGCTQHMTGDQMMFSSLDKNVVAIVTSSLVTIAGANQRSWYNFYLKQSFSFKCIVG